MIVTVLARNKYTYDYTCYRWHIGIFICVRECTCLCMIELDKLGVCGPNVVVYTLAGKPHLSAGGSEQKHHYQLPINHVITVFPHLPGEGY